MWHLNEVASTRPTWTPPPSQTPQHSLSHSYCLCLFQFCFSIFIFSSENNIVISKRFLGPHCLDQLFTKYLQSPTKKETLWFKKGDKSLFTRQIHALTILNVSHYSFLFSHSFRSCVRSLSTRFQQIYYRKTVLCSAELYEANENSTQTHRRKYTHTTVPFKHMPSENWQKAMKPTRSKYL